MGGNMHGEIKADLTTMPFENMLLLFGGIAVLLILFAIVLVVLVRKLGVKNIGPIKLEQHGNSTMFNMNNEKSEIEKICRRQMRHITNGLKTHINNIFIEMSICPVARVAISSAIRFPMYESIANNHFTTELMPENYDPYRSRIIEMMRDEYIALFAVSMDMQCNRETLPPWDNVSEQFIGCIDLWLKRISREVMLCCEKKLTVYYRYLNDFEDTKDMYRIGIVKKCIEKNEMYITVLKRRIG